jgi:hypothetical protein
MKRKANRLLLSAETLFLLERGFYFIKPFEPDNFDYRSFRI